MSFVNILQIIEIIAVITGAVFALYQLRQYRRRRDSDAAMVLLHSLQTPEFSHGMGLLFELSEGLTKEELREETDQQTIGEWIQWLAERIRDLVKNNKALPAHIAYSNWTPPS